MTSSIYEKNYWQGQRIRLRPMHANDVDLWLEEEQNDSEAVRYLNYGMTLPKSAHDAKLFASGMQSSIIWMSVSCSPLKRLRMS